VLGGQKDLFVRGQRFLKMGIIGSLRVSNFSLDVVTNAPKAASGVWRLGLNLVYQGQQIRMYKRS
jgi:hypothetical protein